MINTMFSRLAPAVLLLTVISPALAGEVGVTNSFSRSTRQGTGTSELNVFAVRTETGGAVNAASKTEVGLVPPVTGTTPNIGIYAATASGAGFSNYTEIRTTNFNDKSNYNFTDLSGSHSVSSFAN